MLFEQELVPWDPLNRFQEIPVAEGGHSMSGRTSDMPACNGEGEAYALSVRPCPHSGDWWHSVTAAANAAFFFISAVMTLIALSKLAAYFLYTY